MLARNEELWDHREKGVKTVEDTGNRNELNREESFKSS